MSIIAINARHAEEIRVATWDKQQVSDLYIENTLKKTSLKDIYAGVIKSIESSLAAVFVDYGAERHGFLQFKDIASEYARGGNRYNLKESLKIGQSIIVQVKKEEREDKGAALTTYVTLPGTYLVLMPNNPSSGGVSKQITHELRKDMADVISQLHLPSTMSVILRTAGVGCSIENFQHDLALLLKQWEDIKKAFKSIKAPFLIFQEGDILARTIRDYVREEVTEIIVDESHTFAKIQDYVNTIRPDLVDKLRLYQERMPLFLHLGIEEEVESAFQHTVRLPSGGSILLNRGAAGVMIDVNSGSSTKHGDIGETALKTNLEAATMVARQLRLRDLGGLILIDFIGMKEDSHKKQVESQLWESTAGDRARIQIGHILPRFDVLVISRQRLRSSLGRVNEDVCPTCQGQGICRSVESLALSIIRTAEKKLFLKKVTQIRIEASVPLITYLSNEKRMVIYELEKAHKFRLLLLSNPHWEASQYKITSVSHDEATLEKQSTTSYTLLSNTLDASSSDAPLDPELPAVERFLQVTPTRLASTLTSLKQFFQKLGMRLKNLFTSNKSTDHKKRFERPSRNSAKPRMNIRDRKPMRSAMRVGVNKDNSKEHNITTKRGKKPLNKPVSATPPLGQQTAASNSDSVVIASTADKATNFVPEIAPAATTAKASPVSRSLIKRSNVHRYGGEPRLQKRGY